MKERITPHCISCTAWGARNLKRLIMRVSEKQEARRPGLFQHKFKQRPKPVGWLCLICGAMFTDAQLEKCRLKTYGSSEYDFSTGQPKKIPKKIKEIKGLADLVEEIQNANHYWHHD